MVLLTLIYISISYPILLLVNSRGGRAVAVILVDLVGLDEQHVACVQNISIHTTTVNEGQHAKFYLKNWISKRNIYDMNEQSNKVHDAQKHITHNSHLFVPTLCLSYRVNPSNR